MKLAVMQPYFFPYLGYFQLMSAVERFVILDDVAFIKKGWIHRNNILLTCNPHRFALSIKDASQNRPINQTRLSSFPSTRERLLKTLTHAYRKAPRFQQVFPLVEKVLDTEDCSIANLALASLTAVKEYLGLATEIIHSSTLYGNSDLKGQERILDICRREQAEEYFNLPGGKELYDKDVFSNSNIALRFIQPKISPYPQFDCPFVPWLSIIDVMMFNGQDTLKTMLNHYDVA